MRINSTTEAGAFVKSLRESRGLSRKELSDESGIPLRTVYALENGELRNFSVDRFIALLKALGARLEASVEDKGSHGGDELDALIWRAAAGGVTEDRWGILQ